MMKGSDILQVFLRYTRETNQNSIPKLELYAVVVVVTVVVVVVVKDCKIKWN